MAPSYDSAFDSLYEGFREGSKDGWSHQEIAGNRVSVTQDKGQGDGTSTQQRALRAETYNGANERSPLEIQGVRCSGRGAIQPTRLY